MYRLIIAAASAAALTGCVSLSAPKVPTAHYRCESGADLNVQFPEGRAVVTLPDASSLVLPQQISGSGFRYGDGRYDLRGKGDDATWSVSGQGSTHCRAEA